MEYRSAVEVSEAFHNGLQLAISCVTRDVLNRGGRRTPPEFEHAIFLPRRPTPLSGQPPLSLEVSVRYVVEAGQAEPRAWTVRTLAYRFQLSLRDGPELLAYHWHPDDLNPIKRPHLHLSAGAALGFSSLAQAHLPTGAVALHDVLRVAIEELGVRPIRSDWHAIL